MPRPLVAPPDAYSITEGKDFVVVGAEPVVLGAWRSSTGRLSGL